MREAVVQQTRQRRPWVRADMESADVNNNYCVSNTFCDTM